MFEYMEWNHQVTLRSGGKLPIEFFRGLMVHRASREKLTLFRRSEDGYGTYEDISDILASHKGHILVDEMETSERSAVVTFEDHFVLLSGYMDSINITVEGFDKEFIDTILDEVAKKLTIKPPKGCVMMLAQQQGGLYLTELGEIDAPLERGNYTEKILQQYDNVVAELRADSPGGRLSILDGPPGTGKSYLIRGLITEAEALYVYVPASICGSLTGPDVLPVFLHERERNMPIVLIMEDADATVATRQIDNVGQLSDLLNMSDGILGEMADIRIIATTNQKKAEIDSAVLRTGRVNEHMQFATLTREHASDIFCRLTKIADTIHDAYRPIMDVTKKNTLASVYGLARKYGWKPEPKRKKRERDRWSNRAFYRHASIGDL
jgi:hypothetical protein